MTTIQDQGVHNRKVLVVLNLFDMTTIQDPPATFLIKSGVLNLFDMTTIQDQHFNIIYSLIHITPVY